MKQQHEKYYCKVCRQEATFCEHAEFKGRWICCQCNFVTTNPITKAKMPITKKPNMNDFWNDMAKKSQAFQKLNQVGVKSC